MFRMPRPKIETGPNEFIRTRSATLGFLDRWKTSEQRAGEDRRQISAPRHGTWCGGVSPTGEKQIYRAYTDTDGKRQNNRRCDSERRAA